MTKGGTAACRDIDIFKQYSDNNGHHIMVGQSLTFFDKKLSEYWEPGAATPQDRIAALKQIHDAGIYTWASIEPVIDTNESIKIIREALPYTDYYKIGKINHMPEIENKIDYNIFLFEIIKILRTAKKPFYIKKSLRTAAPSVAKILKDTETEPDIFNPKAWQK